LLNIFCNKCKLNKNESLFYKHRTKTNGHSSTCKECQKNHKKETYILGQNREAWLRYQYKISIANYNKILISQNNKCAICKSTDNKNIKNNVFYIDHDHNCCSGRISCGKCIRGLLCNHCNVGLGALHDNIDSKKDRLL
jgi:hypothetical protein